MGAGSSTEQQSPEQPAGSNTPSEPELSGHGPAAEEPGAAGEPADADPATKALQKNGQLSAVNGVAEQGDVHVQEGKQDGQEEEVVVEDVGQRESEDVREKDRTKEMAANSAVVEDITKDGQEETPEIIKEIPASENVVEETAQPAESQANDVGFKKVFKFVGFKFTVKKDKNEKSDPVQLLTVQKDEGAEATVGAGDHQEPGMETGESAPKESELKQSTEKPEDTPQQAQSGTEEIPLQAESGQLAEEEAKDEGEEKQEKEPTKSAESPTSPASGETTSSFKKFFTHGWSGWRKKTSFKKPKEDELEASEKRKEQEAEKVGEGENDKAEGPSGQAPASEQQEPAGDTHQARLSADYEKVELPLDDQVGGLQGASEEKCAPLATEVFDEKVEAQQEVVAEVHVSTVERMPEEQGVEGAEGDVKDTGESSPPEKLAEEAPPQEAAPAEEPLNSKELRDSAGDHTQLTDLSPDEKALPKHPEGIVTEADLLSSQERIKAQGSPLKKLFSSSGLKKLSGKKQKGKRGGGGDEEPGELQQVQTESPESTDEHKGESSASSPEELEDTPCLDKGLSSEVHQEGEAEEGATSDGEKKREGITPWASFKKMVTPKKRVRRPSESDKEDEVDKVKSATLSSTESTMSEMQEEGKTVGEEQKPEEPKRKVDTSVSWEALICVGSSKKRARKASSSDDEEGPRTVGGDGHREEEASKDKEAGAEAVPASTEEHDQAQGGSSPEPAGSPSEGEGVSTWESFKRLVTPRKKSKSKLEEKTEDSGTEPLASDIEPSKEESWVSIKKFIPGRRKKRPDGKQEQATVEDVGPAEVNEDDPDVPAVVPLSEYDAVEREKMELQQAEETEEGPQLHGSVYVSEEVSKTLVHTVSVAVIDGSRAVTSTEERSPSWISASVTEPLEHAADEATPSTEEVTERDIIAKETPTVTQTLPEGKDAHDDAVISEAEFTSEAVTAAETTEALRAEEVTEASGAEETTDMVSAVSQLTDSPDTTEEATPVQEVEGVPDREEQERQTQAVLQAVAEKVKEEPQALATQTVQRSGPKALEKVEEVEEDSEVLAEARERDIVVLEEPVQGGEAEHSSARGSEMGQSTPDSLKAVPDDNDVTAGVELKDGVTTCQAGEPQQLMDQGVAPDSSETLTDSETNGSTPLADSDAPDVTQQDEAVESQDSKAIAADGQSQVTEAEAAPAQEEGPSVPPSFPPQEEEHGETPGRDVLEPTQDFAVEAVPDLAKTEVGPEAGHSDGEGGKDGLCVEGHTDGPDSREKVADAMGAPECQEEEETEEVQSISPEETEVGADVEKEKMEIKLEQVSQEPEGTAATPEHEETHPQPTQTADASDSEGEKEVSSLEGHPSLPDQDKAGCIEVQVQSSDPPVTPMAIPVREVAEEVKIAEADERVGAHLMPSEKSSEKGDHWPLGPESQAESVPVIASPAPESTLHSDPQGEIGASQKQRSDDEDDEQTDGPDGKESAAREGEAVALELQSESTKLVQNIIQTAVDQFTRTETAPTACPPDSQTQVPVMQADSQGAQQMLDREESRHQASAQEEAAAAAAQEGLALTDISKGMSEPSEKVSTFAVDQQCERVIVPLGAEGDGNGAKPVPSDDCAKLGEGVEKLPPESKDPKGHAADGPQHQSSAQAEADASGNLTKESPDANGPKLTEEGDAREVGVQEGKTHTETKPQTEEDLQEPEGDLAES